MPTENSRRIREFLKGNVYHFGVEGGGGPIVSLPEYEIHPREFLEFAENELADLSTTKSIVNCVSNLKRAIDCQVDIFLYALNLLALYKKRNLGIDRKLGFIEKCGIFNQRSLSRINTIRNKLEHHYQIPKIEDIEVYFDLVTAFVSVMETQLLIGGGSSELEFDIHKYPEDENKEPVSVGFLKSTYDPGKTSHSFSWEKGHEKATYLATHENLEELAAFISYHILLKNINDTYHGQYANTLLEKL